MLHVLSDLCLYLFFSSIPFYNEINQIFVQMSQDKWNSKALNAFERTLFQYALWEILNS